MTPFNASILRYCPDYVRGEIANVGLLLLAQYNGKPYVMFHVEENYSRLSNFFFRFDGGLYRTFIRAVRAKVEEITRIVSAAPKDGEFDFSTDLLDQLISKKDICFHWSQPITGIAPDLRIEFNELFDGLVGRFQAPAKTKSDSEIAIEISKKTDANRDLGGLIRREHVVQSRSYKMTFPVAWNNGVLKVMNGISLDYSQPAKIVERANTWCGRLYTLGRQEEFKMYGIFATPQGKGPEIRGAFEDAISMLKESEWVEEIFPIEKIERVFEIIRLEARPITD